MMEPSLIGSRRPFHCFFHRQLLFLMVGLSVISCSSQSVSSSSDQKKLNQNLPNQNGISNSINTHSNHNKSNIPIGHLCHHDSQCANSSICFNRQYEDGLMLKVCQCDPNHMNRVGRSCLVKPGHQCYYPERDQYGYAIYKCMFETECRSGVNKSALGNGYCMCEEQKDEEPFRWLDVENEIWKCSALSNFSTGRFGIWILAPVIMLSFIN